MVNVVLYEPEIPENTGNIMRTCAATNSKLHLIRPIGFAMNDSTIKRSGVNYIDKVEYTLYDDFYDFCDKNPGEGKTYSVHIYDETQTPTKNHTDWPGKTLKGLQVGTDYYYYAIPNTLFSGDGKPLTIIFTNGDTANIWQARSQSVYKNKNIFLNKDGMFAHWN